MRTRKTADQARPAQTIKNELGGSIEDISKIEGLLLLKQKEAEKKQKLLDAFDFRAQDKDQTKQLVDDIDERIAALNAERYSLNQNKKKILASLEDDQILFNPDEAQRLFEEVGVLFEPPRVLRRLQHLRRWSYEQVTEVLPGSARARRAHGAGAPSRLPVAVGSD